MFSLIPVVLAATCAGLFAAPRQRFVEPAAPRRLVAQQPLLLRMRPFLVPLAFLGGWALVGGTPGLLAGGVVAGFSWRVLGRAESPGARRRREELDHDLPVAVQLLGACLQAGAAISTALEDVSGALPGAVAEELLLVRHRLALGVDPATVWADVAEHPQLGALGRSLARAHRSGASVRDAVTALVGELAAQSRARTDVLARGVEVRAAAPLGVCFLPAFVLLGVVPMVVGVFSAMRLFG
jgi:Flp pilus assembly protein TadB